MEYIDYYQVLGVSRDASKEDITRAYRQLARKYDTIQLRSPYDRVLQLIRCCKI